MKAGPQAMVELPSMLVGLAKSEIEVVEPLPIEFSQATPTIAHPSEAMQWLNAHHVHSPVTRHALVVLESIDAVDLAFDTFVCSLLDGELDTSGYPEYNAVLGGVAAHWDEATGDMICRGVVGWGGRGVRGDTDRIGAKLLAGILSNILASQYAMGLTAIERPVPAAGTRWPRVRPLRLRVGPRAGVLLPEVRHAPPARLTDVDDRAPVRLRLRGVWPTIRDDPRGLRRSTRHVPAVRRRTGPQGDRRPDRPFQGIRLGEEGTPRGVRPIRAEVRRGRVSRLDGRRSRPRPRTPAARAPRTPAARAPRTARPDPRRRHPRRPLARSPRPDRSRRPRRPRTDRRCRLPATGSRSRRRRPSWRSPTSTSRPARSAALGARRQGSRASSSVAAATSGAVRSGRCSRRPGAFARTPSSPPCSRSCGTDRPGDGAAAPSSRASSTDPRWP